jgi:hypothetical protein
MTAAERQRRRRARLRAEKPPQKPGRPRLRWQSKTAHEIFHEELGQPGKARSARRGDFISQYVNFAEQALGVSSRFAQNYSAENVERYKPLMRKGILEQLGRHLIFLTNSVGWETDEAVADVREWADDLLIDAKNNTLSVGDVISFFRGLREPQPEDRDDHGSQSQDSATETATDLP